MANIIPCNQIEQEADRLKVLFEPCYKLKASDLDSLADLAYSSSLCGESGSGGTINDQNNIFKTHSNTTIIGQSSIDPSVGFNASRTVTVEETEILNVPNTYTIVSPNGLGRELITDYYFLKLGKGTYGSGGTPVTFQNFLKYRTNQLATITSTTGLPPVIEYLVGDINQPHTVANETDSYIISNDEDLFFIISADSVDTLESSKKIYRFTGNEGTYGLNETPFVFNDFILVEDLTLDDSGNPPSLDNDRIEVNVSNCFPYGPATDYDDIAESIKNSFKGIIATADNTIHRFITTENRFGKIGDSTGIIRDRVVYDWKGVKDIINGLETIESDFVLIERTSLEPLVSTDPTFNDPEIVSIFVPDINDKDGIAEKINTEETYIINNNDLFITALNELGDIKDPEYSLYRLNKGNGTYGNTGTQILGTDLILIETISDIFEQKQLEWVYTLGSLQNNNLFIGIGDPDAGIIEIDTQLNVLFNGLSVEIDNDLRVDGTTDLNDAITNMTLQDIETLGNPALTTKEYVDLQSLLRESNSELHPFYGTRLFPKNDINGYSVKLSSDSPVGYFADNQSGGINGYAGFTAKSGGTDYFRNLVSLQQFSSSYGITKYRDNGGLYSSESLFIFTGTNAGSISFTLGQSATPNLNQQDDVLLLNSDRSITAPSLTNALIDSGGNQSLITKQYLDANSGGTASTGLEAIDEGSGIGWRLIGRDDTKFSNIGLGAVDFSNSEAFTTNGGAVGEDSFAVNAQNSAGGRNSFVSGYRNTIALSANGYGSFIAGGSQNNISAQNSFIAGGVGNSIQPGANFGFIAGGSNTVQTNSYGAAFGANNIAQGRYSFVSGFDNNSRSFGEFSIGIEGIDYTPSSTDSWVATDRIFNVGNGIPNGTSSNAFTIYKNGAVQLHPVTEASITNPTVGMMIIDSADTNKLKFYDGTAWRTVSFT